MGLSGSKTSTTTGASKEALPYLQSGSSALQSAYDTSKDLTDTVTSALGDTFSGYSTTNPTLTAANNYNSDVLSGKYLTESNPYLQGVIDTTNASVADQINALFSKSGQTGSSRQIGELAKQLSSAENNLRYQNYSDEMSRMDTAANTAATLNSANNENVTTQAALGELLSSLGIDNAATYASGLGSLWGNSTTTTQKNSGSILGSLLSAASAAGSSALLG